MENNNMDFSIASVELDVQLESSKHQEMLEEAKPSVLTAEQVANDCNSNNRASIFNQRRYELLQQLENSVKECVSHFKDGLEFATDDCRIVQNLCIGLELSFEYGLRGIQDTIAAAGSTQEIFNLNDSSATNVAMNSSNFASFWTFCKMFLTEFDKERFDQLQYVNTLEGKGRAFLRTSLNEQSLAHYMANWFNKPEHLQLHYSPWSLLNDTTLSANLLQIIESLNNVLFALDVDKSEFNNQAVLCQDNVKSILEEPIIYAPLLNSSKQKSKSSLNAVNRPITTSTHNMDVFISNIEDEIYEPVAIHCLDTIEHKNNYNKPSESNTSSEDLNKFIEHMNSTTADNNFVNFKPLGSSVATRSSNSNDENSDSDLTSEFSKSESISQCENESNASNQTDNILQLKRQLEEVHHRCCQLENRVEQLSLENHQLLKLVQQRFHISNSNRMESSNKIIPIKNFQITIPNIKLHQSKRSTNNYYLYEIRIVMQEGSECWSLWRRYNDFYKLHKSLYRTHPSAAAVVRFPPKKRFGNLNIQFVEQRRKQLQYYLHNLIEQLPQVEACTTKNELLKAFPFLRDNSSCLPQPI